MEMIFNFVISHILLTSFALFLLLMHTDMNQVTPKTTAA